MSKRSQILFRVAVLSAAGFGLMGCQWFRQTAGLDAPPPDEFAVLTKAPLIIPPDFNLRPPSSGAPPTNQLAPTAEAQSAMFGAAGPQGAAAGIAGNYSAGEQLLLANANVQNADPAIRTELQSDEKQMLGANQSFTDRILFGKPDDSGQPVDADAQLNQTLAPDKPADAAAAKKPTDSATIGKKSSGGGWFDWF